MGTRLVGGARTRIGDQQRSARKTLAVSLLILTIVGAYVALIVLYSRGASAQPLRVLERPSGSNGTTVTLEIEDVQSNYTVLMANLTVLPGAELLDPVTHSLKQDLSVAVTSVARPTTLTWSKGMFPGVVPVPLTLAGDIENWPFDRYRSGPVSVEMFIGSAHVPERATVTFFDRLPGWKVEAVPSKRGDLLPTYRVKLHRSLGTAAFAVVILAVLVAIAVAAAVVAIQTLRKQRKFQPPMTTWYAAMLFAVVPLRNAFPGSPPFGSYIDMVLVVWVIVVLVLSMLIYILCWWRDLKPDPVPQPA
jgi:hypothetical protein